MQTEALEDREQQIDRMLASALRAALLQTPEEEIGVIAEYMHGVADVVGIALSMLVGRGLIEAECVERCLRDTAETWRKKGAPIRALALEREAGAIAKIGKKLGELKPLERHLGNA